jgi:methylthioribose-1-phosphate isomerase
MRVDGTPHRTVDWQDGELVLIDQPALPYTFRLFRTRSHRAAAAAIADMTVRGAGAIGAAGGYALALGAFEAGDATFRRDLDAARAAIAATRPTAQNLFFALDRVHARATAERAPGAARDAALEEAIAIAREDEAACEAIGRHGAALLRDGDTVATHCNAGWLAFVDWGSALAPIYRARRDGLAISVLVGETRPRGQGARLTAWELRGEGVPHELVADVAMPSLLARGAAACVLTGADRIARNGDVANKIGTFGRALAARYAGVPFYVAAPSSTFDPQCPSGAQIPIEERSGDEVRWVPGVDRDGVLREVRVTWDGCPVRNPAFDVTPHELIDGLITEHGVFPANASGVEAILRAAGR